MDNYYYIITGLPELTADFDSAEFHYDDFRNNIVQELSKTDRRLVDWFEFNFVEENLCHTYYDRVAKSTNTFIRDYLTFDKNIRNTLSILIAKKESKDASLYTIDPIDTEFEEYQEIKTIFSISNIIDRERKLDNLKWKKISDIVTFEYFNMNVVLAFLAKAKLVDRWSRMDKEEGARLFERLVQEVRGTYKGINNKQNKK
ncbi:MAG: DUF2764 family protein [Bacteroidales bacterium]